MSARRLAPAGRLLASLASLAALAALAMPAPAPAADAATPCDDPRRLQAVTRLWRDIKWFHPAVARGQADWDHALVATLPALMCAADAPALKSAIERLIEPLHDAALGVTAGAGTPLVEPVAGQPAVQWAERGTALVRLNGGAGPADPPFDIGAVKKNYLDRAKTLVIDYRAASGEAVDPQFMEELVANVIGTSLVLPAERIRVHAGYAAQSGPPSDFFHSAFQTADTRVVAPAPGARRLPIVFLTNGRREIPPPILALQHRGDALILVEGARSSDWTPLVRHQTVDYGLTVRYAAGELVFDDGCTGFQFDGQVPAGSGTSLTGAALRDAVARARHWRPARAPRCAALPALVAGAREDGYATMRFPDLAWRQLAVIKLWSVIDAFYPYRQEIGTAWAESLPRYVDKMRHVASARDYALTLAEMAAGIGDDHVFVRNRETRKFFGASAPDVELAMLDGQVAVTRVGRIKYESARRLQVGDAIQSIDGRPARERIAEIAPYVSASNTAGKMLSVLSFLLAGPRDSTATLGIVDRQGVQAEVKLAREAPSGGGDGSRQAPWKPEGHGIYYVDLTKLVPDQVDPMFAAVADAKALVFDLRGYPNETGWALAARIEPRRQRKGPIFRRPLVSPSGSAETIEFVQTVEPSGKRRYRGRVVVLIDERTVSQAEHTALLLESVTDVTYVGSNSAGTDGDLTNVLLPGNLMVAFSGFEVKRYAGGALHPAGIAPDIPVKPTLQGLRQGHDDVLDAALRHLEAAE